MIWTAEDAAIATGGAVAGSWQAGALSIDSRNIKPGELFVALKGERVDGHAYVADALARGAAAAVVTHVPPGVAPEKLLIVPDVQQALERLAKFNRARAKAHIIGLTGSVGKTSTKEMLRSGLSAHGETFASHGNFNNHIGTPLNLASLPPSAVFGIFEMGMNHAGEISALTRLVRPQVAMITNVEAVHLEFFKNIEAIAEAKAEIFEGLAAGGTAILNRDSPYFERCAARVGGAKMLSFGRHAEADCRLASYRATPTGSEMEVRVGGKDICFTTGTIGAHWALTAASVLACAQALHLYVPTTAAALADFKELPGRGSLHEISVPGGTATLIDDSYNASPAALRAAFARIGELRAAGACRGRVIAALGDMLELGADSARIHAALARDVQACGIDVLFTVGPLMQHLHEALPPSARAVHVPDAASVVPLLRGQIAAGDLVLVKGSHGSHMYTVAQALVSANEEKRNAL